MLLRRLEEPDAIGLFAYRSLEAVSRYQGWAPTSLTDAEAFVTRCRAALPNVAGSWYQLAITERSGGDLLGDCGIHCLAEEPGQVELGISLAPEAQGQGYATETLRAILAHLFERLGKHRVVAHVDPRNTASCSLFERVGMRREAHHIESYCFRDEWVDDVVFALLAREWKTRPTPSE